MLPPMLPRRVQPLAGWSIVVVFALIGAALLATVWSTRASILDASATVRCGQADAVEQAVRADLADLEGPPTQAELDTILRELSDDGLRYVAMVERKEPEGSPAQAAGSSAEPTGSGSRVQPPAGPKPPRKIEILADAGDAAGAGSANLIAPGRSRGCKIDEVNGRLRMELRALRRMKAGDRAPRFVIEVEPVHANQLREAATLTLGVGALAAAALLGVAFVLIRREARRQADAQARERERRLASLGEMSAVLAHEIKNPLASLKGNAQLLARMLPDGDKPRSKADRVVDEAMRLEKLTNDLLQFVRTGTIHRALVEPAALLRDAAASFAAKGVVMVEADGARAGTDGDAASASAPAIVLDTSRAPAEWSLDGGRIKEVVINLLDNAIAAGPPVHASVRRGDGGLIIEVADRGPGVAEDDREKIFEPFFTGKTQGTGLGLAIVRRVVELHHGTIAVYPNPGGGALFRAEIPDA